MSAMERNGADMTTERNDRPHQEGMALVLAIMVLLLLTVIGAALMANVNTETKISGLKVRDTQALSIAEAGVQEAMLRLRNGDVVDDLNPRNVTIIFNQQAGSLPPVGADTTALPTLQPVGAYLNYSTAGKSIQMLSMKYKTKNGVIQRYDDLANPKINTVSGNPIWVVTATGTSNGSQRSIYAEICRSRFNILAHGAVVAQVGIQFKGNINVCGHNHRADTPPQFKPPQCDGYWDATVHSTCMPGAWSEDTTTTQGSPNIVGEPTNTKNYQTGFYTGPWDALGMTQQDFWFWVGGATATPPNPPKGVLYLDNDGIKQNGALATNSASWTFNGGDGEGLLYVDGDLNLNGSFTYRGMIYCEGDLTINGNAWILGGLIVHGKTSVKIANGSAIILYSGEAMQQTITKYGGNIRTIAWKEN
jgi:Tfp pilus assembly protein PilX